MAETNLQAVWHEVENLLNQNISVIPVRDRDEVFGGKIFGVKTPYKTWKEYQLRIIERGDLWNQMHERNTTAIAMVCGAISGNLEVIDFDVKYKAGIDAIVVAALNDLYPDIMAKIRVHRTPSGGTHLVYRITDHEVPASAHLAERPATEEELELDLSRNKKKSRCFIETRGTGGLATAPPSLGYAIIKNIPVQQLTWTERCSIIELCKSFNEYIPELKPYTPPKTEINYYDENPFEHYNRTVDPKELFEQFGWTYVRAHGNYKWFTRPGGKRGEVHAGFNTNTCTYRVWGTKSDLEADKSYTPSTILAHYRFNGDKSATYAYLVQSGYGRIKPAMEATMARNKARQGVPMPGNASPAAVQQYTQIVEQLQTALPHGIFWQLNDKDAYEINRLQFTEVATKLGWRATAEEDVVQIIGTFIYRRTLRNFFDCMRDYIMQEPDHAVYEEVYNALQPFLEKHGKFESTQLPLLEGEKIITDTRDACCKFYTNGYVHITAQGYELLDYDTVTEKLIWHEKIQQRAFVYKPINATESTQYNGAILDANNGGNCGLYTAFLRLACDLDNNRDHIMKCIGYLTHDYKDEDLGYIIVLTEKCENPDDGGGSGKNLFGSLLGLTTSYTSVPGSQIQLNEKFLQSWNGERVFCISDAEEDFKFGFLKDITTGKVLIKKLFKNEKTYDVALLPKILVNTNYSYEIKDGGLRRRIIHIEFTDFFTVNGGVRKYFGKMFPRDWQEQDYADYDNFICTSIQLWLHDMSLNRQELSSTGWEKQFKLNYGNTTVTFIQKHWEEWKNADFISNVDFNKQMDEHLVELGMSVNTKYRPTSFRINKALKEWATRHDYTYHTDVPNRISPYEVHKGKKFLSNDPPF